MSRPDPIARALAAATLATAAWTAYCAWRGDQAIVAWTRITVEDLFSQKRAIEPRVDRLNAWASFVDERLDGFDARVEKWSEKTSVVESLAHDLAAAWPIQEDDRDGIVGVGRRELWESLTRLDATLKDTVAGLDRLTEWARKTDLRVRGLPEFDDAGNIVKPEPDDDYAHSELLAQLRAHPRLQPKMRQEIDRDPGAIAVAVLRRWLASLGDEERQPLSPPTVTDPNRLTRFQLTADLQEHPAIDDDERDRLAKEHVPVDVLRHWYTRAQQFDHPNHPGPDR